MHSKQELVWYRQANTNINGINFIVPGLQSRLENEHCVFKGCGYVSLAEKCRHAIPNVTLWCNKGGSTICGIYIIYNI